MKLGNRGQCGAFRGVRVYLRLSARDRQLLSHRGDEVARSFLLHAAAQHSQADVLAQRERARAIHGRVDLTEHVRLVVVADRRRRGFRLRSQRHVEQTGCGLTQLAAHEETLRALSLE